MTYNRSQPYVYTIIVTGLVILGQIWPQNTFAFHYRTCDGDSVVWDSNPDRFRISDVSFPSGSSFRTAIEDVVNDFNLNPSNFQIDLKYDERYVRVGGAQSEVWASRDHEAHLGHDAIIWVSWTCREIKTIDIVFNADSVWTSGTDKTVMERYGGSAISFRASLMHELGHAIGLLHEGDEYNSMGQAREHLHTNCSEARAYLGEDASDGAVFLYGANASSGEDVGVVHWKWNREVAFGGTGYDYSDHTRTRIHPVSEPIISWFEDEEPIYLIRNGQTIEVEFTFENNGNSRQRHVPIGFYLSTNACITDYYDQRIGGFVADLGRNQVWTTTRRITLPDDLEGSRYYYIGAIIDELDDLDEFNEENNATYIAKFMINPVPLDE